MKTIVAVLSCLLIASCASSWVDPHIYLRSSQVRVECLDDPLGLAPQIENSFNEAGVSTKPSTAKAEGDLVLKVTYRFTKSPKESYFQSIQAEMVDLRYGKVEAKYSWGGREDSVEKAAKSLVKALTEH